jgi:hypothetical protein
VFDAVAGDTYYFMVESGSLGPGNLVFNVELAPPGSLTWRFGSGRAPRS